jgi:pimeloyl-ACP methyl ester carboxylesterase
VRKIEPINRLRLPHVLVAVAALIGIATALWQLRAGADGLVVTATSVNGIPVTVFRPAQVTKAPLVIITHGFAGSQQLMQPFAETLAHNGYVALTFDFPGHGRNAAPLTGGLANADARTGSLMDALDAVVAYGRTLPWTDGRLALLGHSMSGEIIVRYAQLHPDVAAVVAVSPYAPGITATTPRNLEIIVGGLEPAMLRESALGAVEKATGGVAQPRITYGRFADGTARRMSVSGGVEHIGVLYSRQSLTEALGWLDQTFARHGEAPVDARGPWIGLLFLSLVALAWPLAQLLPRVAAAKLGAGLRWRRLLPVALLPAVLTPLILWKLPTDFLPILLGDYLAVHFALYGLLTGAMLWWIGHDDRRVPVATSWPALTVAAAMLAAYSVGAIGWPIDAYLTSFWPIPRRLPLVLAVLAGTLPYFIADEWATRGAGAGTGGYVVTKLCFLLSLLLAVALNLPRLFFLIIIVPMILLFLIVYGLFATWAYRRTWHPVVGAVANALAFAWAIAVTFPVVR